MQSYNFRVAGGRDNTVRIPVPNPGGTLVAGRLLVSKDGGPGAIVSEATVTFDGNYAVVQFPASISNPSDLRGRWELLVSTDGSNFIPGAQGGMRVEQTSNLTVDISNAEVEIANASGDPLPVSVTNTVPVTVGNASLPVTVGNFPATTPLAAGSEIVGFVSPTTSKKVAEGKFFVTGAAISLGGLGSTERACLQIVNPSNSGKVLYIVMLTCYSSIAQQIIYTENGTMNSPTAVTPFNINRASANASVASASHSVVAPSGGTTWPNQSRVTTGSGLTVTLPPLVLPPGRSFLIRGTVGDAQTFTANVYWYEE